MDAFTMEIPDQEELKEKVAQTLQPLDSEKEEIASMARKNTMALMDVDLTSLEDRKKIVATIDSFGSDIVSKSSAKNDLLKVRVGDLSKIGGESGVVVKSLSDLQMQMKDLDPSAIDFTKEGVLGKIFNPIRAYFAKYEKADSAIDDIIKSLEKGKITLKNDNTTLEIEQHSLRDLTLKLNKQVELGTQMDAFLTSEIEMSKAQNVDPEKIKFLEEEVLFPLRQKLMDLAQMQIVNQQGVLAMEILRRNNKELIRAVERAQNVTISALRIAVTVASGLYHQKIVLQKIDALNQATNHMLSSTAKMLKEQGADIQQKSMDANISVETLKTAFADTFDALDSIDSYKQKALPLMQTTIMEFQQMAKEGEARIQRIEKKGEYSL